MKKRLVPFQVDHSVDKTLCPVQMPAGAEEEVVEEEEGDQTRRKTGSKLKELGTDKC